jgi:hypothetical protein
LTGFDRFLGIDTPARILRLDALRYDEVSEKMVLGCPAHRGRESALIAKLLAWIA